MIPLGFLRTAAKLAWRGLKRSPVQSIFLLAAGALSISGISGVQGAARVARETLQGDARAWLGGDLAVDTGETIDERRLDIVRDTSGIRSTIVSWTMTMAASSESPDAGFIALKAVEPSSYPFYGGIALKPAQSLAAALESRNAAVTKDLLSRFQVRLGDTIKLGGQPFRISAVIQAEPERYNGFFGAGMRAIISQESLSRTQIPRSGNAMKNRLIIGLPPNRDLNESKRWLQELFPEGSVIDFQAANRQGASRLETFVVFSRITALFALVLGALGMAIMSGLQLERRMPTLLVMKLTGARAYQIAAVSLMELALIYVGSLVSGAPLGLLVRSAILTYCGSSVQLPAATSLTIADLAGAAMAGVIAIAPLAIRLVLSLRRLRPAAMLRSDIEPQPKRVPQRTNFLIGGITGIALTAIAATILDSWRSTGILAAALTIAVGGAFGSTASTLALVRQTSRMGWLRRIPRLRYVLAGISRPGNQIHTLAPVLAVSAMLMTTTFTIKTSLMAAISQDLPVKTGLLIAGFEDRYRDRVRDVVLREPGVEQVEVITQARAHLAAVDNVAADATGYTVGCRPDLGRVGKAAAAELSDTVARQVGAHLGSHLRFDTPTGSLEAVVSSVRPMNGVEDNWYHITIDCRAVDRNNLFDQALVQTAPDRVESVRRSAMRAFPTLAVISSEDILAMIQGAGSDAVSLLRVVAWYEIGVGSGVFFATTAASRSVRRRDIGLLGALGARRNVMLWLFTCEFVFTGALAGLTGGLLAFGLASVVATGVVRTATVSFDWKTIAVATFCSAGLSVLAGWLPLWRLLRLRPLQILRTE